MATSTAQAPHQSARPALPHPRWRLPLLGDLLTINPAKPTQTSLADAQRLGPIFERRIVNHPIVIVSGAELITEINDEHNWTKHVAVVLKKLRPIARDGLFTAYNHEPNWAKAHNILAPAFSREAMRGYHPAMTTVIDELLTYWTDREGRWTDVADDTQKLTLEIIARTGFDYTFDSFTRPDDHPFVGAMLRGLTYINRNSNLPPLLQKTLGRKQAAQHQKDIVYVKRIVNDVIAARRLDHSEPGSHHDLLDLMLTTADPDTGQRLDDDNIRNQILTFLVAGHETSASTLAFILYQLANHPEIADTARAEVDARFPGRDKPDITYEDVARLPYLRQVLHESLRLWPIAPGYFREARHDVTIGDGRYRFATGDWVFVLTLAAHRDPTAWGHDAEVFDPDRFRPERLRQLGQHVYKPFGTGTRACIGRQFAYHEILLTLAHILHTFTFEPEPGYQLDIAEQITLKPRGFRIRLQRRTR